MRDVDNSRSYRVEVGGTVYRRNRRQLACAGEEPRHETSRDDATSPPKRDDAPLSLSDRIPEKHFPPVVPDVLPCLCRSVRERNPPRGLTTTFRWSLRRKTLLCKILCNLMDVSCNVNMYFSCRRKMDFSCRGNNNYGLFL